MKLVRLREKTIAVFGADRQSKKERSILQNVPSSTGKCKIIIGTKNAKRLVNLRTPVNVYGNLAHTKTNDPTPPRTVSKEARAAAEKIGETCDLSRMREPEIAEIIQSAIDAERERYAKIALQFGCICEDGDACEINATIVKIAAAIRAGKGV